MPLKRYVLDGKTIGSMEAFYDQLSSQLMLPSHFGRNLDALWDVLSTDTQGPFEIEWKHADYSRKAMGKEFERVHRLLKNLENERDDFTLKIIN